MPQTMVSIKFAGQRKNSTSARSGFAFQIKVFFLLCVITAGIYGAITVSQRILLVQALPAAIALTLLWLA